MSIFTEDGEFEKEISINDRVQAASGFLQKDRNMLSSCASGM